VNDERGFICGFGGSWTVRLTRMIPVPRSDVRTSPLGVQIDTVQTHFNLADRKQLSSLEHVVWVLKTSKCQ